MISKLLSALSSVDAVGEVDGVGTGLRRRRGSTFLHKHTKIRLNFPFLLFIVYFLVATAEQILLLFSKS